MNKPDRLVKLIIMCVCLMAPMVFALADDMLWPKGWRMPSKIELGEDWRQRDAEKFSVVTGDFNGDGILDRAALLVSQNGNRAGLYVSLSAGKKFKIYTLVVGNSTDTLSYMGITKVVPGKYATLCGGTCERNEPSELLIRHDAIEYFAEEKSGSYFYWDGKTKSFKRVWISD